MKKSEKLNALRSVLGFEEFNKGDECIFFCPKHSHHKPKLSVNLETDYFHCWICGWKGKNLKPVLFYKGNNEAAQQYSRAVDKKYARNPGRVSKCSYEEPVLPKEFWPLSSSSKGKGGGFDIYKGHALRFLKRRGISDIDILRHKLGFCFEGEHAGRVIFPSFGADGELNFWVGRKYYDHIGQSYRHENFDKNIIFNDYLIDWNESITLVEGPLDAIAAGENAIPLQGTILRDDSLLFAKIITSGVPVYLALDSDARSKQFDMITSLLTYGVPWVGHIEVESFGGDDVSALGKEKFRAAKESALMISSTYSLLKMRVSKARV